MMMSPLSKLERTTLDQLSLGCVLKLLEQKLRANDVAGKDFICIPPKEVIENQRDMMYC